jgi:hypothetical protein
MIQTATDEVIVPEGAELIDECFYVWKTHSIVVSGGGSYKDL